MKTRPSQRLREKEQKGQQRKQNRVTNIEICVSTADEEDMDMARWQTPNRHRLINAWKMQQLPELDNSRHFQPASQPSSKRQRKEYREERRGGESGATRDALLVNKSFERIFTHNLSSLRRPDLASDWDCFAGRGCCRTAAQEICQCSARCGKCEQKTGNLFACSAHPLWHTQRKCQAAAGQWARAMANVQMYNGRAD